MAKSKCTSRVSRPVRGTPEFERGYLLNMGHIREAAALPQSLSDCPVVTREDCYAWVGESEVMREVLVAYRGAVRRASQCDFDALVRGMGGPGLKPGTVLCDDGEPFHDRALFMADVIQFATLRLLAFAESRGVSVDHAPFEAILGDAQTATECLRQSTFSRWVA